MSPINADPTPINSFSGVGERLLASGWGKRSVMGNFQVEKKIFKNKKILIKNRLTQAPKMHQEGPL